MTRARLLGAFTRPLVPLGAGGARVVPASGCRRVRRLVAGAAGVALGFVLGLGVAVPVVSAADQPPSCPVSPQSWPGDDDLAADTNAIVRELREHRRDTAELCMALRHRLVEVERTVDAVGDAVADVEQAVKDADGAQTVSLSEPVTVDLDDHERDRWLDSASAAAMDMRSDLWGIAGLGVGLLGMLAFWRFVIR